MSLRVIITASALKVAVMPLAKLATGKVIEICAYVLIEPVDGAVRLTATNLDMWRSEIVPADATGAAAALPAQQLFEFARRVDGDVAITVKGDRATLVSGRSRLTLPTRPAVDYPPCGLVKDEVEAVAVDADQILAALPFVSNAISTEATRYYLCGAFVHGGGGRLHVAATDGHNLARVEAGPFGGEVAAIVPTAACAEIASLKGDEPMSLAVIPHRAIIARRSSVTIASKLVDGTFPDYTRVIPAAGEGSFSLCVDAKQLASAVELVVRAAGDGSKAIAFMAGGERLRILTNDLSHSSAEAEVDASSDGGEMTWGLNGSYVLSTLSALDCETVRLTVVDPVTPVIFEPVGHEGRLRIIMPLRVRADLIPQKQAA